MGRCKSLSSLKSFLPYACQLSGPVFCVFRILRSPGAHRREWLQSDGCQVAGILSFLRALRPHRLPLEGSNRWWLWQPCLLICQEIFHFSVPTLRVPSSYICFKAIPHLFPLLLDLKWALLAGVSANACRSSRLYPFCCLFYGFRNQTKTMPGTVLGILHILINFILKELHKRYCFPHLISDQTEHWV